MAYTIVGLFPSQDKAESVSKGLESAGIKNEDYIVYLTDKESNNEEKPTMWQRLFGGRKPVFISTEVDKLITSVAIHDEAELERVKNVFDNNEAVHTYEFQDMTIEQAKDLDYVKKIVRLRAKSSIYAMPEIVTSSGSMSEGITSETKA